LAGLGICLAVALLSAFEEVLMELVKNIAGA
jgi:hypothetical protein